MSQDQNQMLQYLQGCLSGSQVQKCQDFILQSMKAPGFIVNMMKIANDTTQNVNIRQLALANMQNCIRQHWNPSQGEYSICEQDRQILKGSFLDAISGVAQEKKLVNLYKGMSYDLIAMEYPTKWPNLIDDLNKRLLESENQNDIYASLVILQQAFKVHEYMIDEDRYLLEQIISKSSTGMQKIGAILSQNYGEQTAEMMKLILKCYDSAIYLELCPILADKDQITNWMCLMKIVLDFNNMPQEITQQTQDVDAQEKMKASILWKNKKWVGRILNKFVQKYAKPVCVIDKPHLQHIPEIFSGSFAIPFLESFLALLIKLQNEYVSPQAIHFALKYIFYSLQYNKAFQTIHPYLEKILFDICLPLCAHTLDDEELWKHNADEYLRKEEDYGTTTHQNKNCAMELIEKICTKKDSNQQLFLYKLLPFICQCLENNADPRTNQGLSIVYREGLFWVLGRLKEQIINQDQLHDMTENILIKYVIPEFNSQAGLLRARACWVMGMYSTIDFKSQETLNAAVSGVCQCLSDKEMPVRIRAAIGLDGLVKQPNARELLKQNLETIFRIYIELMNASDNEGLAAALEGVVSTFQDELSPYAYGLVEHLADNFQKFIQKNSEQTEQMNQTDYDNFKEEDDDVGYQRAAVSCLDSICNILDAKLQTSVYEQMEEILAGVIDFCLLDTNQRYLEEGIGILNQILYNQPTVSGKVWFYFPYFMYAIMGVPSNLNLQNYNFQSQNQKWLCEKLTPKGYLSNFLPNLISPFKNFIAKGKTQLFSTQDFFGNNLFTLLNSLVEWSNMPKPDSQAIDIPQRSLAQTLFIALIENNPQNIDNVLPGILDQALQNMLNNDPNSGIDKAFKVACAEVISVSLYFNTEFTFQYLINKNIIEAFYNQYVQLLPAFKHDYDKGRVLLGLAAVLKLQENQMPQQLVPIMPLLVKEMVKLTGEILVARQEDDSEFESDLEEDIDDEDDTDLVGNTKESDAQFMHKTISKLKKVEEQMNKQGQEYNSDDDDDYSDVDYNVEESIGQNFRYDGPLDQECEIMLFNNILQGLPQNNQYMYNLVAQAITQDDQQKLGQNIEQAKKEWEEWQSSK